MKIADGLTKHHIVQALADLDQGIKTRWGSSHKYDLAYHDRVYPPKAVLGRALCIARKLDEFDIEFDGGEPTNKVLRDLGFQIVPKKTKRQISDRAVKRRS